MGIKKKKNQEDSAGGGWKNTVGTQNQWARTVLRPGGRAWGRGSTQMGLTAPQFDRVTQHSCWFSFFFPLKTLKLTISLFVVWQLLLHVTLYRSAQHSGLHSVCCSFLCAQGLDCQATWAGQLCLRACGTHRQRGYAGSTVGSVTAEPCCPLDAVSQLSPDPQEAVR